MDRQSRRAGVLLHPTSLPSPYGIGDLGDEAFKFIDFLEEAGQHLWQILPLTHTGYGDSPYQSFSAFAGQPLLISPDHLMELGLLERHMLPALPSSDDSSVDYGAIIPWKEAVYTMAFDRFYSQLHWDNELMQQYRTFCHEESAWLPDYALFMACKKAHGGKSWLEWEMDYRKPTAEFKAQLFQTLEKDVHYYQFLQFIFFMEWAKVKTYANERHIEIIGDIPIFVSMDSADVWAHQELFQLEEDGYPTVVAGVPPDYFSATGQLWGNPLYKWEAHEEENFAWWISRISGQLKNLDILRIDHFRGFEAYWSVPYGEENAINGEWVKAPGEKLFTAICDALGDALPIIAEDLGIITDEVDALREKFHFPGMKVLQFAFDDLGQSNYLPHQFTSPDCVCYTGTHDNDTTLGWFNQADEEHQDRLMRYCPVQDATNISHDMIRLCYSTIATFAVVPLQDILAIGSEGRMNTPGVAAGNWGWRYTSGALTSDMAKELNKLAVLYGRH